ncbi:MAG: 6,7-dimethyl-8-ribityllumazine synthase [Ignavibacteriales bacterium]|nr:6,7-dimethyl-8-ribityllumazine synthase [Ignavibacteriales bacterium]
MQGGTQTNGRRFAIVVSRFNEMVTKKLLDGALQCFESRGADLAKDVDIFSCPGAFEIPQVVSQLLSGTVSYDAVVTLGAVIRGETPHFEYICTQCSRGVMDAACHFGVPVLFGVLTTDTFEQAMERAGGKVGNKGTDAALAAIEMADLYALMKERNY